MIIWGLQGKSLQTLLVTCHIWIFVDAQLHVLACFCLLGRKPGIGTSPSFHSPAFILFTDLGFLPMFYILFVKDWYFLDPTCFKSAVTWIFRATAWERWCWQSGRVPPPSRLFWADRLCLRTTRWGFELSLPAKLWHSHKLRTDLSLTPFCSHTEQRCSDWLQIHDLQTSLRKPEIWQYCWESQEHSVTTIHQQFIGITFLIRC